MKYCIFHIPYKLNQEAMSAPMLRPRKLIQAFQNIGYCVDVVEGTAKERAIKIKDIKNKMKEGRIYDFMYAESSTMPTILTEAHHLPTHPFLDFSFFKFIKKNNIKIGLFYRDIYWKFESYKKGLPAWKSSIAILCYKYDLMMYEKLLNKFYIASPKVLEYIDSETLKAISSALPPGSENIVVEDTNKMERNFYKEPLHIFYVGGLGNYYQIVNLMEAVNKNLKCELTICCREKEWETEKNNLEQYRASNIHIIHKSNTELEPYYEKADICSLMFKPSIYINMAMPYKSFEYLAHLKPVLATRGTAIGDFVKTNDIGWSIDYTVKEIKKIITVIIAHPELLQNKIFNCKKVKQKNTWEERVKEIVGDLQN